METGFYFVMGSFIGVLIALVGTIRLLLVNEVKFSELNKLAGDNNLTVMVKRAMFFRHALVVFEGNRYFSRYRGDDKLDGRIKVIHCSSRM